MIKQRVHWFRLAALVAAWSLVVVPGPAVSELQAQAAVEAPDISVSDEYDHWRGSSMGIRIKRKDGQVLVGKVHDYVADSCPFQENDRIIAVADIELSPSSLGELGKLLSTTDPDTELSAEVEREGEPVELVLTTFRKELIDIPVIVERLRASRIIRNHLERTERPDFLDQVAERLVKAVQKSNSPREAAEAINEIIDEIDVSHTSILPRQSFSQLTGGVSGDLGVTLQRHEIDGQSRYFVIDRMPGSAIYESDIKLGDEIISINNMKLQNSRRLILAGQEHRRHLFFIQVEPDEEVSVRFRRRQNSNVESATLVARQAVPAEDVIQLSARVIESGENRYGYMRFWNLMSMKTTALADEVMEDQFDDCHMLILDLRGRGGLVPVVLSMDKLIRRSDVPVIAITDDLTRSAKEMLSLLIKEHPHVTVIGQRTAGAVTGATMAPLPSGNGLMYPALSSEALKQFTGDVVLEGVGVEPDIHFDFQIPWCGGNDRLLEAAVETADEQIEELLKTII